MQAALNTAPVLLILGAGPSIGSGVARAFAAKGYRAALASRTVKDRGGGDAYLNVQSGSSSAAHAQSIRQGPQCVWTA